MFREYKVKVFASQHRSEPDTSEMRCETRTNKIEVRAKTEERRINGDSHRLHKAVIKNGTEGREGRRDPQNLPRLQSTRSHPAQQQRQPQPSHRIDAPGHCG